jgi:hypothetical protein
MTTLLAESEWLVILQLVLCCGLPMLLLLLFGKHRDDGPKDWRGETWEDRLRAGKSPAGRCQLRGSSMLHMLQIERKDRLVCVALVALC